MPKWNRISPDFSKSLGPTLSSSELLKSVCLYGSVAAGSALLSRLGPFLLKITSLQRYELYFELLAVGVIAAAVIATVRAFTTWRESEETAKAQKDLKNPQRVLLGLAATPTRPSTAPKRTVLPPPSPPHISTPATPPVKSQLTQAMQRSPWSDPSKGVVAGGATPGSNYSGMTPMSASSFGQRPSSMLPSTPVTTPEQMRHYQDLFRRETTPLQPPPSPLEAFTAYDPLGYTTTADSRDVGVGPQLPMGRDAPNYCSSWMARKTKVHQGPDSGLAVSGDEEVSDFLSKTLQVRRSDLDTWTDALREWFALVALRPLLQQAESAHTSINSVLERLGEGVRVAPLEDVVNGSGAGVQSDTMALLLHCQQRCQALAPSRPVEVKELHSALQRYQQLLLVLRGKSPADLLPPAPSSYIWARLHQLARGTCLPGFSWNRGGDWNGREWGTDLPTDSALLLYLFAAFLQAPSWDFPEGAGRGMPLFLGQLPSSRISQYSAILAHRIDKPGPGVDAVMAVNLQSTTPLIGLLLEGRTITLSGPTAVFHILLLFLLFHRQRYNGMLGDHYLSDDAVKLSAVFDATDGLLTVWRRKLLGW